MHIAGDNLRPDAEELLEMFDPFPERGEGLHISQVSDMVTEESIIVPGQTESIFQFQLRAVTLSYA